MNVDIDTLVEYANSALVRPSDASFWDERCYTTHVPVIGWADRGDDILEESNYHAAKSLIEGAAEDPEHVFEGSAGHWLVGSLQQVWVQVYETFEEECDCEPTWQHEDGCEEDEDSLYCERWCLVECDGEQCLPEGEVFTAAFIEAVEIQEALKDYPILDESDYSEREWERFESNCTEALGEAQREYADDTLEEENAIENAIFEESALSDLFGYEANAEVSWERVAEIYAEYRDAYFLEKAYEVYRWNYLGYNPNQLTLDIPA
ncbi:hypothetical protein FDI81_gp73 [Streptomyces phage Hydra]|uniref:Uncharacterized protein n=1 Tax=Streptomyces phage Hydra TaxID=1690428 RepID=A0A0K1Y9R0_9CAUD|nr:hypothetical protein FDI81_gp73 [Streptomyces phage Hydra]AKY03604.1 hypothetical protein SEA_HYDRA_73 [Streptomyces phage Hydra]